MSANGAGPSGLDENEGRLLWIFGSSRSGSTWSARLVAGYDRIPRSASSLSTASTTLCGCRHSRSTRTRGNAAMNGCMCRLMSWSPTE